MKRLFLLFGLLLLLTSCTPEKYDSHAQNYDFGYVIGQSGIDKEGFIENVEATLREVNNSFSRGDSFLVLGRLKNNQNYTILARNSYFKQLESVDNWEEKAILFESIASIDDHKYNFLRAAYAWRKAGNKFRAKLDFKLALNRDLDWQFDLQELPSPEIFVENASNIIIGNSKFELTKDDLIIAQADRVTRDWLSYQIQYPYSTNILKTFSERLIYLDEELQPDIGWHEGARLSEYRDAGIKYKIATGTVLKKHEGKWYAPNENGVFMFEVPIDKVLYPTTRFLREDIAVIIDTHGINMLVRQAIENNATAVIGCCDHPGKIKAAKYLSDRGIKVICNTDKFLPLIIGSGASVLGSAPFGLTKDGLLFGFRPIEISLDEPIIVLNTSSERHGMSYYDTPARYFSVLEKAGVKLNTFVVEIDSFNQLDKVITKAKIQNASIIAVRVFNSDDYNKVKMWLEQSPEHKAILFHSEPYPYGYKLAREFKNQTTFDDINPIFI